MDNEKKTSSLDKAKSRAASMLDITGRKISTPSFKPIIASGDYEEAVAVPVGELQLLPDNEKLMAGLSPDRLEALTASIKKNGIRTPLIVDQTKTVICGNNRLTIARSLGMKTVPVIYRKIEADERADYARRDNLERRHLTREELARALEPILEEARKEVAEEKKADRFKGGGVFKAAAQKAAEKGIKISPAALKQKAYREAKKTKPTPPSNTVTRKGLRRPIENKSEMSITFFFPDIETFDKWKAQSGKLHSEWQNKLNRKAK